MSVQNSYVKNIQMAVAGLIAFVGSPDDIVSRISEGIVGFGLAVGRGTNQEEQVVAGIGNNFLGFAARDTAIENAAIGGETQQYPDKKAVAILRFGYIWVKLAAAQVPVVDGAVFFEDATGEVYVTTAAGRSQVDNAYFQTGPINGLALVRIMTPTTTTGGI